MRVVVVEGILLFHSEALRELFDLTLFVDVDEDERLCRRLRRDLAERGDDISSASDTEEITCFGGRISPLGPVRLVTIPRDVCEPSLGPEGSSRISPILPPVNLSIIEPLRPADFQRLDQCHATNWAIGVERADHCPEP